MAKKTIEAALPKNRDYYSFDRYQLKVGRKLLHISSSWMGFVYIHSGISHKHALLGLLGLTLFFLLFDLVRVNASTFSLLTKKYFGFLMIERDEKRLNSATWYVLAAFLGMLFFGGESVNGRLAAGVPIFYLAFGDTAASVVGKLLGKKRLPWLQGTWVGTFAGFVACLIIGLFYLTPLIALAAAAVAAIAETLPVPILDDNISMVLFASLFLFLVL